MLSMGVKAMLCLMVTSCKVPPECGGTKHVQHFYHSANKVNLKGSRSYFTQTVSKVAVMCNHFHLIGKGISAKTIANRKILHVKQPRINSGCEPRTSMLKQS